MNISLLKKIVFIAKEQWSIQKTLEFVDILLFMLKKFGKQLSQKHIVDFLVKEYPDVYDLYKLLWGSRCTLKYCLLLKQYLQYALGDDFLHAISSHEVVTNKLSSFESLSIEVKWVTTNPMLIVQSATKVYRRSLQDDLLKLI